MASATATSTFRNVADIENPADNLVGIASAASQGAIRAAQFEARPMMRAGEVLETVPGMIVSQHSGEGKANHYYLRGFNRDHGTDFATTVAGVQVNTPTGAHAHGYSDANFLIPELVSGLQFEADIDYFSVSRLPGEPTGGVEDIHAHPALPRSARIGMQFSF